MAKQAGEIRVGVGGWTFEPWRETFYPRGLPQAKELAHLSRALTAIEINGTFYRTQTPATFAKWRDETPEGFVFTVKAPRYAVNRSDLTAGAESIARFVDSGLAELGAKLGPILWQFAPTKKFARDEIAGFLDLLPERAGGARLRHALEARHESFRDPAFVDLARARGAAIVLAADGAYPQFADPTADFAYARIMGTREDEPLGYGPAELDRWAGQARGWAAGGVGEGLALAGPAPKTVAPRDVFLFVISGFKPRNPLAAQALIARLQAQAGAPAASPKAATAPRKGARKT
jgi:uncharacterized protein YecE (DUF72 family)